MKHLKRATAPAMLKILAAPIAVLLSGLFFYGASSAAFTGSTSNTGDSWTAGTVALTNNHAAVLFSASNVVPGYTESHCITVTSTATVQTALQFYGVQKTDTGLASQLNLTVEAGSGGTDGTSACTGFTSAQSLYTGTLANLGSTNGTALTALNVTAPLGAGGSQQFMITATLPANTPDSAQGKSATMDFNWINHS